MAMVIIMSHVSLGKMSTASVAKGNMCVSSTYWVLLVITFLQKNVGNGCSLVLLISYSDWPPFPHSNDGSSRNC